MGLCICKDKNNENDHTFLSGEPNPATNNKKLSETVDELVLETLDVIATIMENVPAAEPPTSIVRLHTITDKAKGWIQLVKSLIRIVPLDHAMAPSVICLLLDDSPLPSKDTVLQVADMVTCSSRRTVIKRERNLCVILGCLAEKLAGPSAAIALLSETTLTYLFRNLEEGMHPDIVLFSLIALEKFAQTSENKATIKRKLAQLSENPLSRLEVFSNSQDDFVMRQVGFCAKWCLDNYFLVEGRKYSYETADTSHINVMMNTNDVSEYLKISADGLEARCDAYSFESVRCTFQVNAGCWYYEVLIITPGVMQIGWATKHSNFLSHEGYGIGDDKYSIAFDGCRRLIWHNAKIINLDSSLYSVWKGGSILGCLLDLDKKEVIFSLDGVETEVLRQVFEHAEEGFFAAASFMSFQQCRFNFGAEPFKFAPTHRAVQCFNDHAHMTDQQKVVLPRHLFLEQLRKLSVLDDSCTLCFDNRAVVKLEPCQHTGFCKKCANHLEPPFCPFCRVEIEAIVDEVMDSPTQATGDATVFT